MFKKIFVIIALLSCVLMSYFAYAYLKQEVQKNRSPYEAVPTDAAIILQSNNSRAIWSRISETNLVWSELVKIPLINAADQTIRTADSLLSTNEELENMLYNTPAIISFHPNGETFDLFATSLCSETQYEAFKQLVINHADEVTNGTPINKFRVNDKSYHFSYQMPFLLFGSGKSVLENSIQQLKEKTSLLKDSSFVSLKNTTSAAAALHCYINFPQLKRAASGYLQKEIAEQWQDGLLFPTWGEFDMTLKSGAIVLSGLTTTDSENNFLSSIITQKANHSSLHNNLPKSIKSLERFAVSSPANFISKNSTAYLNKLEESCACDPIENISSWIGKEIAFVKHSRTRDSKLPVKTIFIESNGTENVLGRLTNFGVQDSVAETVYGAQLHQITDPQFLQMFGNYFSGDENLFFTEMRGYAIFSSKEGIEKIAYQWNKEQTVVQETSFSNFSNIFMARFSSIDVFSSVKALIEQSENFLQNKYVLELKKHDEVYKNLGNFSWQSSASGKDLEYHSVVVSTDHQSSGNQGSNILWKLKLKNKILRRPELMKNHRTNTMEVLVQDESNTIHLIGATGKIKWSKNIEGPIMGDVIQIDVYANNKYQMLFNTSDKIHLIDINGNEVSGYPIQLKAPATNQVSALDYEHDKNYRLLIACSDNNVYNYDKTGKMVDGWSCKGTGHIVINKIEHFVVDGKDYILATDLKGKIYLFDRRGNERATINTIINTSTPNIIDFHKGVSFSTSKITYMDTSKTICEILFNDTKNCFQLDSLTDYQLTISDLDNDNYKEYIATHKNRFEIFGTDKKLIYFETFNFPVGHNFSVVKGSNGNKFLLVENENELYIYNHKFALLPDFPSKGSKLTSIDDINNDGKINVVTLSNHEEIIVYSIDGAGSL